MECSVCNRGIYIRVFESVQSSSESFRAARAEVKKLEQIKEIPESGVR